MGREVTARRILAAVARRLWWRVAGTPRERAENRRRASWQHVPLAAVALAERRDRVRPSLDERIEAIAGPIREARAQIDGRVPLKWKRSA